MPLAPELFRALGTLCEPPDPAHARPAAALGLPARADAEGHTEVFVFQLVPYASVYLGPDGMLGGAARDLVAGFWRALRLAPPAEPDHLAVLLGLYASLAERERDEPDAARRLMWRHARRTLLWEHLFTWLPAYTHAVARTADGDVDEFHAAWARLLAEALAAEAREPAAAAEAEAGTDDLKAAASPIHFRNVPELPGAETEGFVRALLAPARSGLIITRADLARCARTTGLGLRMGERAFVLGSLIDQDPAATFGWLADEAATWEAHHAYQAQHAADRPGPDAASRHWLARARATRLALTGTPRSATDVAHATKH